MGLNSNLIRGDWQLSRNCHPEASVGRRISRNTFGLLCCVLALRPRSHCRRTDRSQI